MPEGRSFPSIGVHTVHIICIVVSNWDADAASSRISTRQPLPCPSSYDDGGRVRRGVKIELAHLTTGKIVLAGFRCAVTLQKVGGPVSITIPSITILALFVVESVPMRSVDPSSTPIMASGIDRDRCAVLDASRHQDQSRPYGLYPSHRSRYEFEFDASSLLNRKRTTTARTTRTRTKTASGCGNADQQGHKATGTLIGKGSTIMKASHMGIYS